MTEQLLASDLRSKLRERGIRVSKNTLYRLAREREITTVKIGAKVLFPEAEVEAFIRRKTVPAKRNFFGSKSVSHTTQDKGVAGIGQSNYGR